MKLYTFYNCVFPLKNIAFLAKENGYVAHVDSATDCCSDVCKITAIVIHFCNGEKIEKRRFDKDIEPDFDKLVEAMRSVTDD